MYYNFLNFPAVRFKRVELRDNLLWYNVLNDKFRVEEKRGFAWANECWDAFGVDDKEKLKELQKERGKITFTTELIDVLIDNYTRNDGDLDFEFYKNEILRISNIKSIEFKHNPEQIVFDTPIGEFKASKLSDIFSYFKNFPNIENKGRHKRCHEDSLIVSEGLQNKHRVATGYNYTFGEGSKFLHTWIELELDGRIFVIDTTRNLLMPRKGYYYIRHIEGPVYKISGNTIMKDMEMFDYLLEKNELLSKLYLSNRHQAVQIYKKFKAEEKAEQLDKI